MKKIHEKEGRNIGFSTFFENNGLYLPVYRCFFSLLSENKISSTDFTIFSVILHEAYFVRGGKLSFSMSNLDIQKLTGISARPVRKSLRELQSLGIISLQIAKNGLSTTIEIHLEKIIEMNLVPKGLGTSSEKDQVPSPKGTRYLGQNAPGTWSETVTHLYKRVNYSLSTYNNRFFDSKKREKFKSDIERLVREGINFEIIEAILELEVENFEKIQTFYGFIKSKKEIFEEILEKYRFLQVEKENEVKKYQEARAIQSKQAEATIIGLSPNMIKRMGPKRHLNQNKGEYENSSRI